MRCGGGGGGGAATAAATARRHRRCVWRGGEDGKRTRRRRRRRRRPSCHDTVEVARALSSGKVKRIHCGRGGRRCFVRLCCGWQCIANNCIGWRGIIWESPNQSLRANNACTFSASSADFFGAAGLYALFAFFVEIDDIGAKHRWYLYVLDLRIRFRFFRIKFLDEFTNSYIFLVQSGSRCVMQDAVIPNFLPFFLQNACMSNSAQNNTVAVKFIMCVYSYQNRLNPCLKGSRTHRSSVRHCR